MRLRVAGWAFLGLLVAAGWGVYFSLASKEIPIDLIVSLLARVTCPIGILGYHFAISLHWMLIANCVTYALLGLAVETLRRQLNHSR